MTLVALGLNVLAVGCGPGEGTPEPTDPPAATATQPPEATATQPPEATATQPPEATEPEPTEPPEETDPPGTPRPRNPSLAIDALRDGQTIVLNQDLTYDVAFTVRNFTLMAPGECGGAENCGHVHLNLDGDAGNVEGAPYNNAGAESPIQAFFGELDEPTGEHTIRLTLHNDDHSAVTVDGEPVGDEVAVNANVVTTSINIVTPLEGSEVALQGGEDPETGLYVPVAFATTGFVLKNPGECTAEDGENCGHVHLNIDGDAGNQEGLPYNNAGAESPLNAYFGVLNDPTGQHTVSVSLHYNDHEPVLDDEGNPVRDEVTFGTRFPMPSVTILTPVEDATLVLNPAQTIPVTYAVEDFTLAEEGTCGDTPNCGHVVVSIDGQAGEPTIDSPTSVSLADLETKTGPHTITVALHNDDGSPVTIEGEAVVDSVDIVVVNPDDPRIVIQEPQNNDTLALDPEALTWPVEFDVFGLTLKAPGECQGEANCGHVHLSLFTTDGVQVGNQEGLPYNNAGASSPLDALFGELEDPTGRYVIRLSVHNDDHSPVEIYDQPVQDQVIVNVELDQPTLTLLTPGNGDVVRLGTDEDLTVPVTFQVKYFTLEAPGECGDAEDCGHVHLRIDGDAGNAEGLPYNNAGASSPIGAKFGLLDDPVGEHTITLSLHNEDHSAVEVDGAPVEKTVTVVTQYADEPFVRITSPANGVPVQPEGEDLAVPFSFVVQNFTLMAPGTCAAAENCGHVHLTIDGEDGNAAGLPYNNAGASSPIDAYFRHLETNGHQITGEHNVTISLHNDDHSAVELDSGLNSAWTVRVIVPEPPAE